MKTSNNHQKTFKKQQKCLNIIDNICRQGTWAKGTGTGEGNWTHGTGRRRLGEGNWSWRNWRKGTGAGETEVEAGVRGLEEGNWGTGGKELEEGN